MDSTTFSIICEGLYKVKFGNLRLFWMHVTSHFKVLCSASPQVLCNFTTVWCSKLVTPWKYVTCDVRTKVKHSLALQHTVIAEFRRSQSFVQPRPCTWASAEIFQGGGTTSTFCCSLSDCWRCSANVCSRNVLPFLHDNTTKNSHVTTIVTKLRFVGSYSKVYYDNFHNRLSADFQGLVLFCTEVLPYV